MQDLHQLPKLRDSLSYLYVEHAILDKKDKAVEFIRESGRTLIPVANLSVLLLGPGTSITHAAITTLADSGCSVVWTGQEATRFYAQGMGETRKAHRLLHQARLVSDHALRLQVVERMYRARFDADLPPDLTLSQIRGMEGVRVRQAYAEASRQHGVPWQGRRYDRSKWERSDPVNRALSAANALLNGLCHAAIVSGGYSPGLGFIHTGKQTSFVYDVADLYKVEITIPVAFAAVAASAERVESRVRATCRERFKEVRLLQRILPDIDALLALPSEEEVAPIEPDGDLEADSSLPMQLWDPLEGGHDARDDS
ncbi:MAG: type I-E CRISPR-associated endonuclease Cas1e [Ardenticatenaceae bacterium]|nr:type I-E CRISPR-associated endonuclease Cas1e [Ardenticatenaceae bacterium]